MIPFLDLPESLLAQRILRYKSGKKLPFPIYIRSLDSYWPIIVGGTHLEKLSR